MKHLMWVLIVLGGLAVISCGPPPDEYRILDAATPVDEEQDGGVARYP